MDLQQVETLSAVSYADCEYEPGDKFSCTPEWAAVFATHGLVRVIEAPKVEKKKAESKEDVQAKT